MLITKSQIVIFCILATLTIHHSLTFSARRCASAVYAVALCLSSRSVRPSVRHKPVSGVLCKQQNITSRKQRRTIANAKVR